jgi:DNA-binding PadR family transcriptional regulator
MALALLIAAPEKRRSRRTGRVSLGGPQAPVNAEARAIFDCVAILVREPLRASAPPAKTLTRAAPLIILALSFLYEPEALVTREALGEFEQMVLLAILQLDGDVYGVPIVDEIQRRTGRVVTPAAVYITMRRLEKKRLVESWIGAPTAERGGKARRHVRVTRAGIASLHGSREVIDRMWKGLPSGAAAKGSR